MRASSVIAFSLLLSGCATTVYKDEASQLGTSASALATAFPSQDSVDAEARAVPDIETDLLMANGPITYTQDCGSKAMAGYQGYVKSIGQSQSIQDSTYASLVKTEACLLASIGEVSSPIAVAAGKGTQAKADKSDLAAEARLKGDEALNAAAFAASQARQSERSPTLATPSCTSSCTLTDYTNQIQAYGNAIQAAATADNVANAQAALGNANTAVGSLLSAAKAPPIATPIATALAAVGKLALQEAQYEAMKRAVLLFDYAWPNVAPAMETAARFRQAQLITTRAYVSLDDSLIAQLYLNNKTYFNSPSERFQLYQVLNSRATMAAKSLKTSEVDPAAAIVAFTNANHSLALAIENPHSQITTITADFKVLSDQVAALQKATASTTTTKSS